MRTSLRSNPKVNEHPADDGRYVLPPIGARVRWRTPETGVFRSGVVSHYLPDVIVRRDDGLEVIVRISTIVEQKSPVEVDPTGLPIFEGGATPPAYSWEFADDEDWRLEQYQLRDVEGRGQ